LGDAVFNRVIYQRLKIADPEKDAIFQKVASFFLPPILQGTVLFGENGSFYA
jgi:hypothetical protein